MAYLRYDLLTGEILAQLQCSPDKLPLLATEGTGLIEGDVPVHEFWIDGETIKAREAIEVSVSSVPLMPSDTPVRVNAGLPEQCNVRVRGTANMPFEGKVLSARSGAFDFVPSLAGRYVVQVVGRYSAPEFSIEVQPLAVVKERRQADVTAKKAEQLEGGILWNGHRWDADAAAQANVSSMASAVSSGMVLPDDFFWTDYDNQDVSIDSEGIASLNAALMTFVFATHSRARQLKEAIEVQTSNEAVMGLDIAEGWPL